MLTYLKLGGILALAAVLFGGGFYFGNLRGDARASAAKTALEAQHAAQLSALASAWQQRELQTQAEEARKNAEIDQIKSDALQYPIPAVRLCRLAVPPAGPANPALPAGDRAPAAAGVVPGNPVEVSTGPGPDVGPLVSGLADYADALVAACRATQPITNPKPTSNAP